ncbi:MAG TPA: serine hydrolase [Planctomycetaceae bacterium]|nr:serine hydrolase [Planctomycetaceae bacterium]
MNRRQILGGGLAIGLCPRLPAWFDGDKFQAAGQILEQAAAVGEVAASVLHVEQRSESYSFSYGEVADPDGIFLLASISKTISIAAVMTLYDEGEFRLDDTVQRYIPEFRSGGREQITIRQLLTHVSGLPDQLPENARLRAAHAPLSEFVAAAINTPLLFKPGERYGYSSMAILLATEIAQRISGKAIADLVEERIYRPLAMSRSAMGLGKFELSDVVMNQVERAAPESGAGDPKAKSWDWNSEYWRKLGAPWGAAHGSARDVAKFLNEFLHPTGRVLQPKTIGLMIRNHNRSGIRPRGLGFDLGQIGNTPGLSNDTFGHTGSTGTMCWADPDTESICVILTTLPYRAVSPHPRDFVAKEVARILGTG